MAISLSLQACRWQGDAVPGWQEIVSDTNKALIWFITDGVGEYYSQGYDPAAYRHRMDENPIIQRLEQEFHVYNQSEIIIDSEDGIYSAISVAAMKGNYGGSAENYVRKKTKSGIYEYWVVKAGNRDHTEILFVIAKAPTMSAPRTIVLRSKRFLESYTFEDGQSIEFPDSNVTVSSLIPHLYPEAFAGTKLSGKRVRWIQEDEVSRLVEIEIVDGQWREKKTDGAKQLHILPDGKAVEYVYKGGILVKVKNKIGDRPRK